MPRGGVTELFETVSGLFSWLLSYCEDASSFLLFLVLRCLFELSVLFDFIGLCGAASRSAGSFKRLCELSAI